ncbi:hypothetical protein B0E38_01829 [Streptomyces sp. 111WW2]|uniref:hypothetical protein n=1 Tax=Streptomyces sp. 111WW2 TaxID=1945515 RepID=UPI000D0C92B2|nr:hypothetical protein [Streptomyces sp. 111WW2]PSK57984.1 hypothetical protein B0E38_01829 [Streptomyces sp. 111WW2]
MPIEPLPCDDGGTTPPVEVTTCCAPSIASAPLCLADGTTILAVVRSGCVECGATAEDPEIVGWLDVAGTFTPGALPPDAGPCDAGCVDTICRQLCDDADGDGEADTTYSELWCIRADGSAELVLTYQDDPSTPYTPVSPVECTYGCPESETVQLCDVAADGTVTPFLRRYSFLNGTATYEDVALDGQTPHVVMGTVGACSAVSPCAEQTTPAATLGLCLADGTPIAVLVTRDCAGTVTQDGWLNLVTGTYNAGDPPLGVMACGNPRSISTTGTFCDIDPASGDVLGLVLIEYTYGPEGAVTAVRLVDATTGTTYTPQGEVTTCPAGVEQPERDLVQLCDTAGDGTVTEFLRDYARNETGAITGHSDYLLDGTPYTAAGTVGVCPAESACRDCTTHVLCDVDANPPATIAGTAASGTLPNGVAWTSTGPSALPPTRQGDGAAWWGVALFPNPSVPTNLWTFNQIVTVEFSVLMVWSPGTGAGENTVQLPAGAVPVSLPPGYTYNRATSVLHADNTLTGCTLTTPTRAASARFRVTGVSSLALRYLGTRAVNAECRTFGHWVFGALDVSLGGEFARTVCRDCTGEVVSSTDTLLDGTTPYTPVGLVGVCQPSPAEAEPCRDSSSTLLCDTAAQEAVIVFDPANRPGADGWQVVSFTGANPGYPPEAALPYDAPHPPGAFMGARTDLNAGPGPAWPGYDLAPHRWVLRKTFTAPEDGIAAVSSVGFRGDGGARVRVNGQDAGMYGQWNQPATSGTAQIPVTAGPNVVEIEVRDGAGQNWVQGRLDIVMTRTQQFMRRTVVDCETGETVSVVDTTLDGEPYTVTGEVGQCEPVAECCEPPPPEPRVDVETGELCLLDADGDVLGRVLVERVYDDQTGERIGQRYVDPVTGDPVEVPAGASLAVCPPEPCRDTYTTQVCDLPVGDPDGVPTATDTSATPYPWDTDPIRCVNAHPGGGQALWDGGTVTIPARSNGTGSCTPNQWLAGLAARLQADRPSCDSGTVTITVAVAARNNGPAATAANYAGSIRLHRTDTGARLADSGTLTLASMPAGTARTMTVTAVNVPAALLAAGQIVVALDVEAWDQTGNTGAAWLLSNFVAAYEFQQDGCETQFLRRIVTDCETGETVSVTDTTLDGEPYTVTGQVGECRTAGGGVCCPPPPPEPRVDVETALLCIRDQAGEITGEVLIERVYDDQSGARTEQRLTDPTTGDPVTLPAGAELVACQEPSCPVAFSTECVGIVERTEASYDNTSLIGGLPGQCGGVQGPGGQFPCQPTTGGLTITSWIVDGEEVIGDGGRTFAGGPCGTGTSGTPGMHLNWAQALTNLDPGGATWSAQNAPACAWFIGSTGGTQTIYGPMVVEDAAGQQWTLTPVQACEETQFTKVYTQECDGSVSVSWLDADGVATDPPEGDQVPCGTGCGAGGGRNLDVEPVLLCDVQPDGTITEFLRHYSYGSAGQVALTLDTGLDGVTPYSPTGTVGRCQPEGRDVELTPMCVVDNTSGDVIQRILAEVTYDTATGERLGVTYVDPLTWGPVAMPVGTHLDLCPVEEPEPTPDVEVVQLCDLVDGQEPVPFLRHLVYLPGATSPTVLDTALDGTTPYSPAGAVGACSTPCAVQSVIEACRCDDTDGDGLPDTGYVELLGVDCEGSVTSLGTYLPDLSAPYTPVAPVACDTVDEEEGADPPHGVQARRVELTAGASWDAAAVPALQSVTVVAHSGTGTITTADGPSTLRPGESVTWSVVRDVDAALTGPLTITTVTGTVTVSWTQGVTL